MIIIGWYVHCNQGNETLLTKHSCVQTQGVRYGQLCMYSKLSLLHEAMQDESAELCFIFRSARSVLYFPLENIVSENIVPEILLRIHCNKPVKVPLILVHYGK